jgi:hypothetical protein
VEGEALILRRTQVLQLPINTGSGSSHPEELKAPGLLKVTVLKAKPILIFSR